MVIGFMLTLGTNGVRNNGPIDVSRPAKMESKSPNADAMKSETLNGMLLPRGGATKTPTHVVCASPGSSAAKLRSHKGRLRQTGLNA